MEDAIELYNSNAKALDLSGWFLSHSRQNLRQYRIPAGTTLPAHGFKVFYEYQFDATNGLSTPFTLNSAHGDEVHLSQTDAIGNLTGYRADAAFGAAANGVSFGRFTNSVGTVEFVPLSARSFGADNPSTVEQFRTGGGGANPDPLIGPVVISEIMFNPSSANAAEDNVQDEYIELQNITGLAVPLFDPAAATNTWRISGGVHFLFPQNAILPPGGFLLLVNFNPAIDTAALSEFRSRYNLSTSVPLFGPFQGHLANAGEDFALYRPDAPQVPPHPDAGFVPYLLVEHVNYSSSYPWPAGANGTGASLQRQSTSKYANDPANWFAAPPTAGRSNVTDAQDTNGDGLPDAWQIRYFGSISDPRATPGADPDGDGFTNLQEYLAGSNPMDAESFLKIDSVEIETETAAIHFTAVAGKAYAILYRADLSTGSWSKLADLPAQTQSGPVTVNDPTFGQSSARFYQLLIP